MSGHGPTRHPVWLVGAGPGDPELMTLKAVRVIREADVLLVDDLVDAAVLEHARAGARIARVGKRGGLRSTPQPFIDRLMVREALAGRRVVRLKGGDPLIFGRAGEEIAALRAAGLEVRIVNGVTSALAAASALQLSLTHRDLAHGVVFVTGHPHDASPPIAWAQLARAGMTLAIYMGLARSASIARALVEAGLAPSLPVAVVQKAGTDDERTLTSTLQALQADIARARLESPAILIVGAAAHTTAISRVSGSMSDTRLRPSALAR
jgi:uroporphyrin-III C-methyltransferase